MSEQLHICQEFCPRILNFLSWALPTVIYSKTTEDLSSDYQMFIKIFLGICFVNNNLLTSYPPIFSLVYYLAVIIICLHPVVGKTLLVIWCKVLQCQTDSNWLQCTYQAFPTWNNVQGFNPLPKLQFLLLDYMSCDIHVTWPTWIPYTRKISRYVYFAVNQSIRIFAF